MKIISGGQTGVDRAALDVALKHGIDCGGWVAPGRLDELGKIPDRYPLTEVEEGDAATRTLQNVKDSDGTLLIFFRELAGGNAYTARSCRELRRPHQLIDAAKVPVGEAGKLIANFVREHEVHILNVAGPRASEWAEGYDYAFRAIEKFLKS
ncbi:MAG: hypothetical protein QOI34_1488 [Verrucomicrobiota bacterium]